MKFTIMFKTPDAVDYAIKDAMIDAPGNIDRKELEAVVNKFVKYGELVTIEFDSTTKTARVMEK